MNTQDSRADMAPAPSVATPARPARGDESDVPAAWRHYRGGFAWPTLLLTASILAGVAAVAVACVEGVLPLWAGFCINTLLAYAAFTPAHEASHWNIASRSGPAWWINEACGWLSMAVLFDNFAVLRAAHLQHHAHTNDPDRDPDYFRPGLAPARVLLRCLTIAGGYYASYRDATERRSDTTARRLREGGVTVAIFALAAALAAAGWWREVLALWVLPAPAAFVILALAFDYVPHNPHTVVGRWHDTRILVFPGLTTAMLGQNYHLIHHLYPSIPFFRYGECFREIEPQLRERGAPIFGRSAPPAAAAARSA